MWKRRASLPETMAAVIADEPAALAPEVAPGPVRWVVERCMDKDSTRRYEATLDLFRDLAKLRNGLSEISPVAPPAAKPPSAVWPWLTAWALVASAGAMTTSPFKS